MSSVLHPVGPEEPQTYWLRRLLVLALVVVLLAVLAWALWPRTGSTAGPAPVGAPTAAVMTSASGPVTASGPTSGSSAAIRSGSRSGSPGSAAPPTPSASRATSGTPSPVARCDARRLRVTLTGPRTVTAHRDVTFRLSVGNGSPGTCTLDLTSRTFELQIYSGNDRIWSTDDCGRWLHPRTGYRLAAGQAYAWSTAWSGQRSRRGCGLTDGLRPGTYVATARLGVGSASADPVQLVMRLR